MKAKKYAIVRPMLNDEFLRKGMLQIQSSSTDLETRLNVVRIFNRRQGRSRDKAVVIECDVKAGEWISAASVGVKYPVVSRVAGKTGDK